IAGQTVVIGCLIINNVPCELLLGRGFLEMMQCATYWDRGMYQMKIGGRVIEIDGGKGHSPMVNEETDDNDGDRHPYDAGNNYGPRRNDSRQEDRGLNRDWTSSD
ncbi:hypothetical protein BGZ68_001641, partial [Mortierella alpina]